MSKWSILPNFIVKLEKNVTEYLQKNERLFHLFLFNLLQGWREINHH